MIYSYKIEQAIRAAAVLHKDQVRKGSAPYPYITHLVAVAFLLSDYTDDEDVIVAGLLHDTLEDTDYTPRELENDFGEKVKDIVLDVTDALSSERGLLSWSDRNERYIKKLKKAPIESLLVSAADKIHNMRTIVEEYHRNQKQYLVDFNHDPREVSDIYEQLATIFAENLKNDILVEFENVYAEFRAFLEGVIREYERKGKKGNG